tara:strand:- start:1072 stop:1974 length:903 start_codon:yes stop_codon:yes gene_type:complete
MSVKSLSMDQWLRAFNKRSSELDFWVHFDFDDDDDSIELAYLNIKDNEFILPPASDFDRAELLPLLEYVVGEIEDSYYDKRTDYADESLDQADEIKRLMGSYEAQLSKLRRSKTASSQASWSILAGGVSDARVEAYKIRIAVNQMVEALKDSPAIEEVYRLCGDTFLSIPDSLSTLERHLDKTNYALITMGADFYRQRLPHSDRETVDIASKYNPAPHAARMINSEMSKEAGVFGNLYAEISDIISDKLEQGDREITISRKELSDPRSFTYLVSLEEDGLVQSFGSYVVITQKGVSEFLS